MGEGKFSDRTAYPYPTFIMTDLNMAAGDGLSIFEHLKNNPEWAIIPTVVLSPSEDPDDIKKSYMLGASCFHKKPASQAGLRQQLKILHDYWMTCSVPEIDVTGRQVQTQSKGRVGERFQQSRGGGTEENAALIAVEHSELISGPAHHTLYNSSGVSLAGIHRLQLQRQNHPCPKQPFPFHFRPSATSSICINAS